MRIGRLLIKWLSDTELKALNAPEDPQIIPGDTVERIKIKVYNTAGKLCMITGFSEEGVLYTEAGGYGAEHCMKWSWVDGLMADHNYFPSLLPELKAAHERMRAVQRARDEYNKDTSQEFRQILR